MNGRGRLAPSPTGDLHLGGAATFLVAWLEARRRGAELLLRIEDIDTARASADSATRIIEDLEWLGLRWDGPPLFQSSRTARYEAVIDALAAAGKTYLCDCSRAEIARVASAPHRGEEGPRYPGTCRGWGMAPRDFKRPPAVRFVVPPGVVRYVDRLQGELTEDVDATVGDFVLRRGDGVFAYQLAVTVDDADYGVDHVVRGGDLLASTARQIVLLEAMGAPIPAYLHAPLVLMPDGARLEKRAKSLSVREHRAAGTPQAVLLGALSRILGLVPGGPSEEAPIDLSELLATYDPARLHEGSVRLPNFLLNLPRRAEIR